VKVCTKIHPFKVISQFLLYEQRGEMAAGLKAALLQRHFTLGCCICHWFCCKKETTTWLLGGI
jgi:hypothetical protein